MNIGNIPYWERWLNDNYPSLKRIVKVPYNAMPPREIIAEVEEGMAVAVISRSAPHFHRETEEHYKIVRGVLAVVLLGKALVLSTEKTGYGSVTIQVGVVHHAVALGDEPAVVEVWSRPAWTPKDHYEV